MNKFLFPIVLLAFLYISCDSGSQDSVDDDTSQITDDDINISDEEAPLITMSDLPEIMEVVTGFTVEISDDSNQVTTTINLNGSDVFQTLEKTFEYEIDPFDFDFDSGTINLVITSTDDSDNQSTIETSLELKKLLIRIPNPSYGSELDLVDVYYAINDLEGKLIAYQKVEVNEVLDFYANDSFSYQDLTLTRYIIGRSPQSFQFFSSASNLVPGTVLPTDDERGNFREEPGINPENDIEISVESKYLPSMSSHNAMLLSYNGFSGVYNIRYNNLPQSNQGEVLYSFPLENSPISEYEYLLIDDFTKLSYGLEDFKKPSSSKTIRFPENGDFYDIVINGFYSETDYQNYRYKQVFRSNDEVLKLVDNSLEIPVLEEFEVLQRHLSMNYFDDKKQFQTLQKGVGTDFFVPDFDISRSDRFVNFTGDYDYSEFFFNKVTIGGDGSYNQFFWSFKNRPTTEVLEVPYYSFELPDEVNQELSSKSQSANPDEIDPDSFTCTIKKYDASSSYEDIIFFTQIFRDSYREDEYSLTLDLK